MSNNNGWETYSKLVLQQLETMSNGIEALRTELQDMKGQLTELKAKEDRVKLFGNPNDYPSSWRMKTSDSIKYSKYVK